MAVVRGIPGKRTQEVPQDETRSCPFSPGTTLEIASAAKFGGCANKVAARDQPPGESWRGRKSTKRHKETETKREKQNSF